MFFIRRFSTKTCLFVAIFLTTSAGASTPFSQYGMIQNVQNYANNPFYNNSTPQITTPRIVYATGPALTPNDCMRTVQSIVENVCFQNNNCKTTTLADVRPKIMVQLSSLPGHNYASSCAGYIDTIYENYHKSALNSAQIQNINSFPTAPSKPNNTNANTYAARAAELKSLQSLNPINTTVNDTDFPTTLRDLSYQERTALMYDVYDGYMDTKAYVPLNVVRTEKDASTGGKPMTECQAVYNCIAQYDAAEKQAEKEFASKYNNAFQHNLFAGEDKEFSADFSAYTTASENLIKAYIDAEYSPCICTQKSKSAKELLAKMNIKKCDDAFLNQVKQNVANFIKNKVFNK